MSGSNTWNSTPVRLILSGVLNGFIPHVKLNKSVHVPPNPYLSEEIFWGFNSGERHWMVPTAKEALIEADQRTRSSGSEIHIRTFTNDVEYVNAIMPLCFLSISVNPYIYILISMVWIINLSFFFSIAYMINWCHLFFFVWILVFRF